MGDDELWRVGEIQRHAVSLFDAKPGQEAGEAFGQLEQLAEAEAEIAMDQSGPISIPFCRFAEDAIECGCLRTVTKILHFSHRLAPRIRERPTAAVAEKMSLDSVGPDGTPPEHPVMYHV